MDAAVEAKRVRFMSELKAFHARLGHKLPPAPIVGGKNLDYFKMYEWVEAQGGFEIVTQRRMWTQLRTVLGLSPTCSISTPAKSIYRTYLLDWEDHKLRRLSIEDIRNRKRLTIPTTPNSVPAAPRVISQPVVVPLSRPFTPAPAVPHVISQPIVISPDSSSNPVSVDVVRSNVERSKPIVSTSTVAHVGSQPIVVRHGNSSTPVSVNVRPTVMDTVRASSTKAARVENSRLKSSSKRSRVSEEDKENESGGSVSQKRVALHGPVATTHGSGSHGSSRNVPTPVIEDCFSSPSLMAARFARLLKNYNQYLQTTAQQAFSRVLSALDTSTTSVPVPIDPEPLRPQPVLLNKSGIPRWFTHPNECDIFVKDKDLEIIDLRKITTDDMWKRRSQSHASGMPFLPSSPTISAAVSIPRASSSTAQPVTSSALSTTSRPTSLPVGQFSMFGDENPNYQNGNLRYNLNDSGSLLESDFSTGLVSSATSGLDELIETLAEVQEDKDESPEDLIKQELIDKYGGNGTPDMMRCTLHAHQIHGLSWMMKMERESLAGGILADDMGLGKTIQTIALIVANPPPPEERIKGTLIVCPVSLLDQWRREIELRSDGLSVHVQHGSARVSTKERLRSFDVVLTSYALVARDCPREAIVSDGRIIKEGAPAGLLFRARWYRVILDEAHMIKNHRGACSLAIAQLSSVKRFCLTGTPLQNNVDDIYPLFRFLKVPRYCNLSNFRMDISNHITENRSRQNSRGLQRLQVVLSSCLLRRTKKSKTKDGRPIITLPPMNIEVVELDFTGPERDFYISVQADAVARFQNIVNRNNISKSYSYILLLILRLRQASDHPHLIKDLFGSEDIDEALSVAMSGPTLHSVRRRPIAHVTTGKPDDESGSAAVENSASIELETVREKMKDAVFQRLIREVEEQGNEMLQAECALCFDPMQATVATLCGHLFCRECIVSVIEHSPAAQFSNADDDAEGCKPCPTCRSPISADNLFDASCFLPIEDTIVEENEGAPPSINCATSSANSSIVGSCESASGASSSSSSSEVTGSSHLPSTEQLSANAELVKELSHDDTIELMKRALRGLHPDGKRGHITSTKISHLLQLLRDIRNRDPTIKTIVFSEFTSMLNLIEKSLDTSGFGNYRRYDGTMSPHQRANAVEDFIMDEDVELLLVSLKAGSVGLNLTRASCVILMDIWWNPSVEDQAINRVYRIGQTKPVNVYRLTVKGTIDDKIMQLQENKRQITAGALGEDEFRATKLSLDDLKFLFSTASTLDECAGGARVFDASDTILIDDD